MLSNRISQQFPSGDVRDSAPAVATPSGFVVVPMTFFAVGQVQPLAQQQPDIYRIAMERAQADARWSRIQKRLFSVWN